MDEFGIILFLILLFIILPIIGWAILLGRIGEVSKRLLSMEAMLEKLLEKKTDTSTEEEVVAVPVAQRSVEPPAAPPQMDNLREEVEAREYISVAPPPLPREIMTPSALVPKAKRQVCTKRKTKRQKK